MEARGSFGGFFFQSFDNNFQTGSTVLFAKSSNGYIGLGGNTNPQAELDITGGLIAKDVFTTDSTGSTITVSRDAVPTSGNGLGQLEFSGEDIDTGNQYVTAQISASAEANWATSSRTTQLNFNTTTGGVLSRALTLKGNNDAEFEGNATFAENVGIGTGSDLSLIHISEPTRPY